MSLETVKTTPSQIPAMSMYKQPSTLGNLKFPNFKDTVDMQNQDLNARKGQAQVTIQTPQKTKDRDNQALKSLEEDGPEEFIPSVQNKNMKKSKSTIKRWLGRNDTNA